MRSNNYAYVNGAFVPEAQASVSIYDSGFLFGDGVFETMPIYGGRIFRFHQHVRRLFAGLERLKIDPPFSAEALLGIFQKLCEQDIKHGVARVYVTRGPGATVLSTTSPLQPTVVAIVWSHASPYPETLRAVISSIRVDNESSLTRIKSANRLMYVLAKQEADHVGVDEALLLNQSGHVVEFSAYNVFAVIDGRLITPPVSEGALPGITREAVMQLAQKLEIPSLEVRMKPADLLNANEVFATNSIREIVAVDGLNGNRPDEKHHVTLQLRQAYRDLVREELRL
jgi:branched-chain amino acid aminotransferase